ncbi:10629_t:CDS:2, partial [Funneliformis geosporum]
DRGDDEDENLIDENDNLLMEVLPFLVDDKSENLIDDRSDNLLTGLEEELDNEVINDFLYIDNIYDNVYDSEEIPVDDDIPQDAYHSMAGKAHTLLEATFSILNVTAEVLNKWYTKHGMIQTTAISQLCIVWSVETKVLKIAFSTTMMEITYHKLQESLMREREMLILYLIIDPNLCLILLDWYVTENPHTFMSEQEFKDENDNDKHPLFQNLSKSYLEHFELRAALLNRKVDFYNSIAYTILEDKQDPI